MSLTMNVRKASLKDLPAILCLLEANGLSVQGVETNLKNFVAAKEGGKTLGSAGLEIYGKVGLLRSVAVTKEKKGKGLGKAMTEEVISLAKKRKLEKLFLLTTTAAGYFKKFGFKEIERSEADRSILKAAQSCCPPTAVVMVKNLKKRRKR